MAATVSFAPIDYAVVAVFGAAILALGFSVRLRSNTTLQFLAAGRSLTLPLFVASLVSLWYGGILGIGESVSYYGIGTWVLFGLPYYLFALLYAFFLAERVRSADQLSIPERLNARYGRWVSVLGAALMFLLAVPAAHALMLGTLVQSFSGWDLKTCILLGAAIGVSFLYRGGLLADVRVSLLAFIMMYVGFGVMVGWCLLHHPIGASLETLRSSRPDLLKWDGGSGLLYVLSLTLVGAWTLVDPGFHQRVTSAGSTDIGKKGVLLSVVFWLVFDILSITAGLYALVLAPKGAGLQVFPALAEVALPAGLKAVFFCGMLGTIVSAMVGYSLVGGTTIGRDVVSRLRPGLSDAQVTLWSRVGVGIACVTAILLARSLESVVVLWTSWAGAVVGAMLIPGCAAYLSVGKPIRPGIVFGGMLAGFTVAASWMVYGLNNGNPYLEVVLLRQQGGISVDMAGSTADQLAEKLGTDRTKLSVGTLMPGLLTTALVIALGAGFSRGTKHA